MNLIMANIPHKYTTVSAFADDISDLCVNCNRKKY